jgi:hypothetical protein
MTLFSHILVRRLLQTITILRLVQIHPIPGKISPTADADGMSRS